MHIVQKEYSTILSLIKSQYLKDEYPHGIIISVIKNCTAQFHYKFLMKEKLSFVK